jgi:hypothetical protein
MSLWRYILNIRKRRLPQITVDTQQQMCLFFFEMKRQFGMSTDQYKNCNCFYCGVP